jgi:hypothetical protein
MIATKERLKNELIGFFEKNPPDAFSTYNNPERKKKAILDFTISLIYKIKFPKPETMVKRMAIQKLYYDLTWQDFSDEILLEEFKKKQILSEKAIEQIVEFNSAFKVKK